MRSSTSGPGTTHAKDFEGITAGTGRGPARSGRVRRRCRPRRRLDCRKHQADLCRRPQTPRRRARGAGPHRRQLVHLPCELARRRILDGEGKGRGQVDGVRFSEVDTSDGLLRVSEVAALDVGDVQAAADGSGRLFVGASKTDQEGRGAGCRSTPSAESSAAGRPRSASRAGYSVTVSELAARNRWPPAGPRLSRCRRRAGGSHRRCRATMHGASWQHGAPSLASATVADKAGVDHTTIFPADGG